MHVTPIGHRYYHFALIDSSALLY